MTDTPHTLQDKPQHTPGPWREDGVFIRAVAGGDGFPTGKKLATVHLGPVTNEEFAANRKLMAGSPELLTALQHVRAAIKCGYDPLVIDSVYGAEIDAAIVNAGGQLPGPTVRAANTGGTPACPNAERWGERDGISVSEELDRR